MTRNDLILERLKDIEMYLDNASVRIMKAQEEADKLRNLILEDNKEVEAMLIERAGEGK